MENETQTVEKLDTKEKIQNSPEYKSMTPVDAVMFVENEDSTNPTRNQLVAAWQYLHDTNLGYNLQGWYARCMFHLMKEKVIFV